MLPITVGTDPEFFAIDNNGKIMAMCGKLGGDKDKPRPLDGGAILEDNVLVELNVKPAISAIEFSSNVNHVVIQARKELSKMGFKLSVQSVGELEEDQLQDYRADIFGCVPDYNVWTMEENPTVQLPHNVRVAGGHIHIGFEWCDDYPLARSRVVKAMDLFLGLPLYVMDSGGQYRREFYGRFGSYRPTKYGVEYRTPSNWWLGSRKKMEYVFNQTIAAVNYAQVHDCSFANSMKQFFTSNGKDGGQDYAKRIILDYGIKKV